MSIVDSNGNNCPADEDREMQASQHIMETDLRGTLNMLMEQLGLGGNLGRADEVAPRLDNARRQQFVELAPAIQNNRQPTCPKEFDSNWDKHGDNFGSQYRGRDFGRDEGDDRDGTLRWNHYGRRRGKGRRGGGGNWWKSGGGQWGRL